MVPAPFLECCGDVVMFAKQNAAHDDDIDDDRNFFTHDCVYRYDGECDDHRHTSMFQLAL